MAAPLPEPLQRPAAVSPLELVQTRSRYTLQHAFAEPREEVLRVRALVLEP
jgi:hypothetical protein